MTNVFVDGMFICYRTLHKQIIEYQSDMGNYGVLYQGYNSLTNLCKTFEPDYLAIVWDTLDRKKLIRYNINNNYKITRESCKELKDQVKFYKQIESFKQVIKSLGYDQYYLEGYEADDLLYSLAYQNPNNHNIIVAWDKDLYQTLSYANLYNFNQIITSEQFYAKYGISPEEWIYIQALTGDASDAIEGIKGIGTISAIRLYKQIGWENILNSLSTKERQKVLQALELVTLKKDCDLEKAKILACQNYEMVDEIFHCYGLF